MARKRFKKFIYSESSTPKASVSGLAHYLSSSNLSPSDAALPEDAPLQVTEAQVLALLTHGELSEQGLLPYSSNHSFLVTITHKEMTLPAVYKPRRGENPLWDFERGTLCQRETAAYMVSSVLGWDLVPPTVLRDGKHGVGSVQLFIANNDHKHYFTVQEDARFVNSLRQLALFDYVINNADRKSGHCLISEDNRLWAIDHGICFHAEYKLRTVIWEFSDSPIDATLLEQLKEFCALLNDESSQLAQALCLLLSPAERAAMISRTQSLLRKQTFPAPEYHRRNYPWPPI